jgi:ribonuclease G
VSAELICNSTGREVRVALMENGRLAELYIDRGDNRGYVDNVYKGKVVRVLPGMQAAFVDIGLERAGFLYVGDIDTDTLQLTEELFEGKAASRGARSSNRPGQRPIQDLIEEGQELLVQVAKDPIGTKGARITTHITLPGRYLVFMPTVPTLGVSRKIEKDSERRRLRNLVEKYRPKGTGFIVRTVCQRQPDENLKADLDFLLRSWKQIQEGSAKKKAPALLHADQGLVLRTIRDLFDDEIERVVVDDKKMFDSVRSFMTERMPELKERVHLFRGKDNVFDNYGVELEIKRTLGRKVGLKSGGHLVIDQTEALIAIDVNSGKFVGTSSLEETTLITNMEAAEEVVHQLRLRNIGGLIIIDFIDMDLQEHRDMVYKKLEKALRFDRSKTNVLRISELGLVEMTRKRVQEGLDRYLMESCSLCNGTGYLRSRATLCYEILRDVKRESARNTKTTAIYVNTTPSIADMLYGERFTDIDSIEKAMGRQIVVRALEHYHPEQFEVYSA